MVSCNYFYLIKIFIISIHKVIRFQSVPSNWFYLHLNWSRNLIKFFGHSVLLHNGNKRIDYFLQRFQNCNLPTSWSSYPRTPLLRGVLTICKLMSSKYRPTGEVGMVGVIANSSEDRDSYPRSNHIKWLKNGSW